MHLRRKQQVKLNTGEFWAAPFYLGGGLLKGATQINLCNKGGSGETKIYSKNEWRAQDTWHDARLNILHY